MSRRDVYLVKSRPSPRMRAHFGLFIPNRDVPSSALNLNLHISDSSAPGFIGTVTHVVGAPMAGFCLEFKRNFDANRDRDVKEVVRLGGIDEERVKDALTKGFSRDDVPGCALERAALGIRPPGKSEDFLAPVNETTNRRCQEWLLDLVRRLVELGWIEAEAVDIVQRHRDDPGFGIGLRPVNAGS